MGVIKKNKKISTSLSFFTQGNNKYSLFCLMLYVKSLNKKTNVPFWCEYQFSRELHSLLLFPDNVCIYIYEYRIYSSFSRKLDIFDCFVFIMNRECRHCCVPIFCRTCFWMEPSYMKCSFSFPLQDISYMAMAYFNELIQNHNLSSSRVTYSWTIIISTQCGQNERYISFVILFLSRYLPIAWMVLSTTNDFKQHRYTYVHIQIPHTYTVTRSTQILHKQILDSHTYTDTVHTKDL